MTANLMFMLGGLILIIGAAAMLGWIIAYLRKRLR
jgi:flagellar biogenesis protein FliO